MKKSNTLKVATPVLASLCMLLISCDKKTQPVPQDNVTATTVEAPATEVADFKTDPHLAKGVREFLKVLNNGGPGLETLSPFEAKKVLADAQASVKVNISGIDVSEKTIESDGLKVVLNIVRPSGVKGKLPVFIFIHGGGWILGDFPTHQRLVRDIVVKSGYVAAFVNYTRTPDAKFPVQINEIYAATKWVAEHGDEIDVDGKNLAVVGNSVGGNMSAVTALMSKDKNGPKIKGVVMMWPIVDANFETESYKKFGKDRFLTTSVMKWMYDFYISDPEKRKDKYASPLQATSEELKGLPPFLVIVAENDVLRDEAEAFGRKLDEAGVTVTTTRYLGMIHDFGMLNGLAENPSVHSLSNQVSSQLHEYLKK